MYRFFSTYITALLLFTASSFAQCPVPAPATTDVCSYSPIQTNLKATGSLLYYNWYENAVGGNPLVVDSVFQTPLLSDDTTFYVAATDTNTALLFDYNNDHVSIDGFSYNGTGYTEMTVETWVKTSNAGNQMIASFDRSEFWRLELNGTAAGAGQLGFGIRTNAGQLDFGGNARVDDGQWHHVAAVYDNGIVNLYIDGLLDATTIFGTTFGRPLTRFGFLGIGSEAPTFNGATGPNTRFDGEIDEFRIWSVARTAAQISSSMNTCLTGSEAGLEVYFPMDEATGTTITSLAGTGVIGQLNNFTPATTWSYGALVSCDCESNRVPVNVSIGSTSLIDRKINCNIVDSLDAGAGYTSYLWSTGETTQKIHSLSPGIYDVTVTGGACSGSHSASIVGKNHSQNALLLDGGNDYLAIEKLAYQGTNYTELTVETWLKTSTVANMIIASFDRSEYWRLEVDGDGAGPGQIGFDIFTNAGILDFGSNARIDDGQWHHVAAVFDNGTVTIYIDGIVDATTTRGTRFGNNVPRYGFIGTGSESPTYNGARGPNNHFNGELDDFKVWDVARTQAQIRDDMCRHVAGSENGLNLYYKFDETTASDTAKDYSNKPLCNARLFNGATRVVSGAPIGDQSVHLYTNTWLGQTPNISSCSGELFTLSNMGGAPDAVHLYYVDTIPNDITGIMGIGGNDRYFGVHKINDNAATYTAEYNYTGNPFVTPASEPSLELFKRADNAATPWIPVGATLNTGATTLTATAQSTEFMLGSTIVPLPIDLLSFEVIQSNNYAIIKWVTASEVNNDFFSIERSIDGVNWDVILTRPGSNSTEIQYYQALDSFPIKGVSYYRLKQTDFDGNYEYSNIDRLLFLDQQTSKIELYPNPTYSTVRLKASQAELSQLIVINALGQDVTSNTTILKKDTEAFIDLSGLSTGVYFIKTASQVSKVYKLE